MLRSLQGIVFRCKSNLRARRLDRLKRRRLQLEQLDDRRMLASVPGPAPGIYLYEGNLKLIGDGTENDAHVWTERGTIKAELAFTTHHELGDGSVVPVTTVKTAEFETVQVTKIYSYGYAGNDTFFNDTSLPSVAYGSSGDD